MLEVHRFHVRMFTQTCLNRRIQLSVWRQSWFHDRTLFAIWTNFFEAKKCPPLKDCAAGYEDSDTWAQEKKEWCCCLTCGELVVRTWQWTTARSTDVYCDTSFFYWTSRQGFSRARLEYPSFFSRDSVEKVEPHQGPFGPFGPFGPLSQVITLLWAVLLHHLPSTTAMQDTPTGSTDGLRRQWWSTMFHHDLGDVWIIFCKVNAGASCNCISHDGSMVLVYIYIYNMLT